MPRPDLETSRRVIRHYWLLYVLALGWLLVAGLVARHVSVSTIAFPSSVGPNVLRRTRIDVGRLFYAESFYQPSSISYHIVSSYTSQTAVGQTLSCRVGLEGWARPRALRGRLISVICACQQPRLHNSPTTSCMPLTNMIQSRQP